MKMPEIDATIPGCMHPAISPIHIIGGGLAGSEAAWQIARAGVPVVLHEMRGPNSSIVRN